MQKKNRIETEPDPIRHHPVSFKERYKDDDYRMANIFTRRCSSKRVPEIRILNSLSFETAELFGTEYNSWSALLNNTTRNYCKFTRSWRWLQSIVGVYKILQTSASNPKAQTLARNIYLLQLRFELIIRRDNKILCLIFLRTVWVRFISIFVSPRENPWKCPSSNSGGEPQINWI